MSGHRTAPSPQPGIFASVDPPILLGAECSQCASITFPAVSACGACGSVEVSDKALPRQGTVWAWTTQDFPPPVPPYVPPPPDGEFRPFVVGFVDLDGLVRVKTLLSCNADAVEIGAPVKLVTVTASDETGGQVLTYAFAPTN